MGYILTIGELKVEYDNSNNCPSCRITAQCHFDESAPAFGEPTDKESSRWPSYTAWHNFCRETGLHDMFYNDEDGILIDHPGCVVLTKNHQTEVHRAHRDFMTRYPDAVATYGNPQSDPLDEDKNNPKCNSFLVRLEWLKYWIDWAMENCERPVFSNS
jgi:hypothetical protein